MLDNNFVSMIHAIPVISSRLEVIKIWFNMYIYLQMAVWANYSISSRIMHDDKML